MQSFNGVGTLLGKFHAEGSLQLNAFTSPTIAEFSSAAPLVFIAANGDLLVGYYGRTDHGATQPGALTLSTTAAGLVQATLVAEFVPDPNLSTGRFAGATGSVIMVISTAPFTLGSTDPISYAWIADGTISF